MTPTNYNTTLCVTRTVRDELHATHEIFICEMGATRVNDIKEICDIVKPKYGIITSIGPQHLESFKSIENVVKTKFELADSLSEDGIVFLNYDNKYIKNNKIKQNKITYGIEKTKGKHYQAYDISATDKGLSFKMKDENNQEYVFNTKVLGKHNIVNIAGCIAVASKLGIPMKTLVQRVKLIEPVEHRQQLIESGSDLIIDDAYNSNPSGAESALYTLSMFEGEKILITPGMIELGEKQYDCNFEFGKQAAKVCDYIILVGKKQTKPIYEGIMSKKFSKEKIQIVEDVQEAIRIAKSLKTGKKRRIILLENDLPDNY
jgi:UDP-N-acetylmuramoyl-tripeptide--D-alanyl-D-alanine ligase